VTDPPVLVVGLGNELRADDAAGLHAARLLRELLHVREPSAEARVGDTPADLAGGAPIDVRECEGEPLTLIELWRDRQAVILLDAMRSGGPPGQLRRLDASAEPLPAPLAGSTSTHAVALPDTIELARALGCLPPRVIVHAVEAVSFASGASLSPEVRAALPALVRAVLREARELAS